MNNRSHRGFICALAVLALAVSAEGQGSPAKEAQGTSKKAVPKQTAASAKTAARESALRKAMTRAEAGKDGAAWCKAARELCELLGRGKRFDELKPLAVQVTQRSADVFGPDHRETVHALLDLGMLHEFLGELEQAEARYREALAGSERSAGKDDDSSIELLSKLAAVSMKQGKPDEAEALARRVVERNERLHGGEHIHTLNSLSNLALVLQNKKEASKAEELERRVLAGREKTLGKEHRDTLASLMRLAADLAMQSKFDEAIEMSERLRKVQTRTLGPKHTDTLVTHVNLGHALLNSGDLERADIHCEQGLAGLLEAVGPDNLLTGVAAFNFSKLREKQGHKRVALRLADMAAAAARKSLPEESAQRRDYEEHLQRLQDELGVFPAGTGLLHGPKAAFKIKAPKGWTLDNQAGVAQGFHCVMYPDGATWADAEVGMYAQIARTTTTDRDELVNSAVKKYAEADKDFKARRVEEGRTGDGHAYLINDYSRGNRPEWKRSRRERVAYVQLPGAVAFIVFMSPSEKLHKQYAGAVQEVMKSFSYAPEFIGHDAKKEKPEEL